MNLEDLKKEFIDKFCFRGTLSGITSTNKADTFWQWFSSKIEPTLLALSKLQLQHLEATEQIEQLEAENEKLKNDIMLIIAPKEVGGGIDAYKEGLLAEARKETKEAIEKVLMKRLMDGSIDFIKIDATRLSQEFDEAIEPQQPSCEGCEQEPLQSKLTCYTCRYEEIEQHRKPCNTCNDFSNYQPKEK